MKQREKLWTQGPWVVMNSGDIFGPLGGDSGDGCRADDNDGWMIAEVGHYSAFVNNTLVELGETPRKANIQLIRSAPLLVDALEKVISDNHMLGYVDPKTLDFVEQALDSAYGDPQ